LNVLDTTKLYNMSGCHTAAFQQINHIGFEMAEFVSSDHRKYVNFFRRKMYNSTTG